MLYVDTRHVLMILFWCCRIDGSVYTGEWKEGKYHGLGGMFSEELFVDLVSFQTLFTYFLVS